MSLTNVLFIAFLAFLPPPGVKGDASSELTSLQEEYYEWHKRQYPEFSTTVGDHQYNDLLTDLSTDVFQEHYVAVTDFINRTKAINRTELSRQRQYSYDVFLDTLTTFTSNYEWRQYSALNPINFLEPFYLYLSNTVDRTPFRNKKDYENYIARLQAYPKQIQQMMNRMRKSIKLNTTYHLVSVQAVPGQITSVVSVPPIQSVLFKPLNETLDKLGLNRTEMDDLRSRTEAGISGLWTALRGLKTFIADEYMNHTRATPGVLGLPSGKDFYRACLKWHLSVDTPPAKVHQIGMQEVERITQNMQKVMNNQGFKGEVAEYFSSLTADPRFHKHSADELLKDYEDLIFKRIYPKLPKLFKNIPDKPVVVKPLPFDGPPAMYSPGSDDGSQPGTFYANLKRPNETDTFSMPAITLHEAVPGHHFQFISQAATDLPEFQKHFRIGYFSVPYMFPFYTAYTEGWGLYSEYLGEELGVYENDYEMMGRYGYDMVRACRVVVDTGMHYLGWSREKAIDFIVSRTQLSRAMAEIEINRYITFPGQACAYKIGELKIKELRQRATSELGDNFDIRDFHALMLNNGAVPLNVMETIVSDYIDEQQKLADISTGEKRGTGGAGKVADVANFVIVKLVCFLVYTLLSY